METEVTKIRRSSSDMEHLIGQTSELGTTMDSSFQEVVARVQALLRSFQKVESDTGRADSAVFESVSSVDQSLHSIAQLEKAVKKIGDMISTNSEISEQTRVLSVNAAIEAARAGDAGKSFRVVASEVKRLAEHTAQSGLEIVIYLKSIQEGTRGTMSTIQKIAQIIGQVSEVQKSIAGHVKEETNEVEIVRLIIKKATEDLMKLQSGMGSLKSGAQQVSNGVEQSLQEFKSLVKKHGG